MPGADSGTFDYFTEVVNGEVDASTSHAQQSEDDNVLVSDRRGQPQRDQLLRLRVLPAEQHQGQGRPGRRRHRLHRADRATISDGTYAPLSRPLFIYPNTTKAKESPALYEFVNFYLANAATLATEPTIGYVAVPDDIAAQQLANWNSAVPQ